MGGRPRRASRPQQPIVQQVAAQLAERLPRLHQRNSAAKLCPCKPAGPLSKGTLSLGGCFLSTPAGPLPKGTLSHGGYFLFGKMARPKYLRLARHARRDSVEKHANFGGLFVLFATFPEIAGRCCAVRGEMRGHS